MSQDDNERPDFARQAINLASPRLGSAAIFTTDDFFAPMARLLNDAPAVFIADKYDDHGKWMDGWESRRRRDGGHDFCVIKLGVKGVIRGVDIDTAHFTGNYPPAASLEGLLSDGEPGPDAAWQQIVPPTDLGPSAHHFVAVDSDQTFNYLRLHMHPDGGIARLRVYGDPVRAANTGDAVIELSAVKNGGRVIAYNDSHYGEPWVILTDGRGVNMGDGWETRRRREPGNDWIIIELGTPGVIEEIEVDTAHFKGNYPDRCSVQGALVEVGAGAAQLITQSMFWPEIMAAQKLEMDDQRRFSGGDIAAAGPVSHVRLNIFPDGGISRLRIFGKPAGE